MELPQDVLTIIKDFSKPITRGDWKKGCYYKRYLNCEFSWRQTILYCGEYLDLYNYDYDDYDDYDYLPLVHRYSRSEYRDYHNNN